MTAENLKTLNVLRDIKENMTLDKALVQIVQAMSAGNEAEDALLDTSKFIIAREIISDFQSVTDEDIRTALNTDSSSNAELSLELLKQAKKDNEISGVKSDSAAFIPEAATDGMS